MLCQEIMKRDVECLNPQSTAIDAAKRMRDANVGFLPICDNQQKVLGTVTDRDLVLRVMATGRPMNEKLSEVMTREVVACRPGDDLRRAEELMAQHQKSRILCIDEGGRLVGVISLSDIAQHDRAQAGQTLHRISEREARAESIDPTGSGWPRPSPGLGRQVPSALRGLLLRLHLSLAGVQHHRLGLLEDDVLGDQHLAGRLSGGDLVHHLQHRRL
jgi:CBS domain-containing protein